MSAEGFRPLGKTTVEDLNQLVLLVDRDSAINESFVPRDRYVRVAMPDGVVLVDGPFTDNAAFKLVSGIAHAYGLKAWVQ